MSNPTTYGDLMRIYSNRFVECQDEFERIFCLSLRKYWNPIHGLDIIKFDEELYKRHKDYVDGISCKEIVQLKYGDEGRELIQNLISPVLNRSDDNV